MIRLLHTPEGRFALGMLFGLFLCALTVAVLSETLWRWW